MRRIVSGICWGGFVRQLTVCCDHSNSRESSKGNLGRGADSTKAGM
jgi:hypothetical protein